MRRAVRENLFGLKLTIVRARKQLDRIARSGGDFPLRTLEEVAAEVRALLVEATDALVQAQQGKV